MDDLEKQARNISRWAIVGTVILIVAWCLVTGIAIWAIMKLVNHFVS